MLSLRFKILLVASTLVFLSQTGTVSMVLFTANADVSERANQSLHAASDVLRRTVENQAGQRENTVSALASDFGFKQAVASGDRATAESALKNHASRANADLAFLIDTRGQLSAANTDTRDWFENGTLRPEAFAENIGHHVTVVDGAAFEVFTVALKAPLPIAWLTMGYTLDDAYTQSLSDLVGMDVSLVAINPRGGMIAASSLSASARNSLEAAFAQHYTGGAPVTLQIADEDFLAYSAPFTTDEPAIQILLTKSLSEAMAPYALLRTASFVLGALPLVAALIGAALLSRTITRPVSRLMEAAKRIRSGDYGTPVSIRSGDELSQFGIAFNAMQDEIAAREERISYQARHDSVTDLINSDYAMQLLHEQISTSASDGGEVAVLMVRLNALADLSSSLGHDVSDQYLKRAARDLRTHTDSSYLLARMENDTFLIVARDCDAMDARAFSKNLIDRLRSGIKLEAVNVSLNPSIGVAIFPEHATDAEKLLLRATIAVNKATAKGQPTRFYSKGDEEKRIRNIQLLQDLQRAAIENQFQLHCQPKIQVSDETVCGMEALIRWDHPAYGWLPPAEFIPLVEDSGNVSIITRWVLEAVARQHRLWRDDGLNLNAAVNFSAHDLQDDDLPWFVMDVLHEHKMPPEKLIAEVTEEAMVIDVGNARSNLRRLRDLGIRISIDDFGTGYSSLSQLKKLPVDELKIDRSFIANLPDDPYDVAITSTAIQLAQKLGLKTVAEGVSSGAALRWLQANGVDQAQGFYWSKPLPAQDFRAWVEQFSGGATRVNETLKLV